MITLTPSGSPIDVNHVMEILSLIGNTTDAAARLAELQNMLDRANVATDHAQSLDAQVSSKIADHDKAVAEHEDAVDAFRRYNAKRTAELNDLNDILSKRQQDQDARERAHAATVAKTETDLNAREDKVAAREVAAASMEKKIGAMHDDLAARLAKLKELVL